MEGGRIILCLILMQLSSTICFQCPGYNIPRKFKCDGLNNCGDNSDEENCPAGTDDNLSLFVKVTDYKTLRWILDSKDAKEKGEALPTPPTELTEDGVDAKSGLIGQKPSEQDMVIMLTTGWAGSSIRENGKVSTFLDPKTSSNIVCNTGEFPTGLEDATGNTVDGKPVICGGYTGGGSMGYNFADHCYILKNGLWSQLAKMSEKRRNLASVSLTRNGKNALFVTGGRDDDIYQKQTTEFIYSNGDVEQGPDLPEARRGHCMAQLDENRFLIMGGATKSGKTNSTLIYDATTNTYEAGPSMLFKRSTFACTVFYSELHYGPVVLAAGGSGKGAGFPETKRAGNQAELWVYKRDNSVWEKTKDLPKLMGAGPNALPNTKGGAILTYGNNVYDLTCTTSSGCKWTENKNQKLAIPRNYHVGISVSAETVLKC